MKTCLYPTQLDLPDHVRRIVNSTAAPLGIGVRGDRNWTHVPCGQAFERPAVHLGPIFLGGLLVIDDDPVDVRVVELVTPRDVPTDPLREIRRWCASTQALASWMRGPVYMRLRAEGAEARAEFADLCADQLGAAQLQVEAAIRAATEH